MASICLGLNELTTHNETRVQKDPPSIALWQKNATQFRSALEQI